MAGCGMVCAGLMLDLVTDWPAFKVVSSLSLFLSLSPSSSYYYYNHQYLEVIRSFKTLQQYLPLQMVPEIIIVVPPLLGLKGNLEMTLAARYVEGGWPMIYFTT